MNAHEHDERCRRQFVMDWLVIGFTLTAIVVICAVAVTYR